jgi:predicted nicotinamide N-methyase
MSFDPPEHGVVAGYSTHQVHLQFGSVGVELLVVKRLEDYVDTESLLRDPDAPEPPYWAHLWTGSRALARCVATELDCAGKRVIEIGCGLALVGIVAALRGATVTLVDRARDGVRFAAANAALNACRVRVVQADVCAPGLRGVWDYCLAADVTYDPSLQTGLADFLATHLAPDGRAWCTESVRTVDQGFRSACERLGLQVTEREVREPEDGRDVAVRITEVVQRSA